MREKKYKKIFFFIQLFLVFSCITFCQQDGVKVFNLSLVRWEKIEDYQCVFIYKEGDKTPDEYKFWFKKDDFRRLEGIAGEHKGTIVVYNPQDDKERVRAKKGFLPPFPLKKDDEKLSGFFLIGWEADLSHLKSYLKEGSIKLIKKEKIEGRNANVLEFIPKKKTEYTKELVWIDSKEHIIIQIERYRDETLIFRKTYSKILINSNLSPDDFKI